MPCAPSTGQRAEPGGGVPPVRFQEPPPPTKLSKLLHFFKSWNPTTISGEESFQIHFWNGNTWMVATHSTSWPAPCTTARASRANLCSLQPVPGSAAGRPERVGQALQDNGLLRSVQGNLISFRLPAPAAPWSPEAWTLGMFAHSQWQSPDLAMPRPHTTHPWVGKRLSRGHEVLGQGREPRASERSSKPSRPTPSHSGSFPASPLPLNLSQSLTHLPPECQKAPTPHPPCHTLTLSSHSPKRGKATA